MQQAGHGLHATVETIASLYDREVELREQARAVELTPTRSVEARRLYLRASAARRMRLALLRRCRLI